MGADTEQAEQVTGALLDSANITKVIELEIVDRAGGLLVCARLDLPPEVTMREVSAILFQARRRVETAVPEVAAVYLEPDVWVDPTAAAPTTSSVVMLGLD